MITLISIYLGGLLTLFIAFYHTQLYSKLNWSDDFEKINTNNAQVFYTINMALTLMFVIIGLVSIIYAKELSQCNGLAFGLCLLCSIFWGWRFVWQVTYQSSNKMSARPNKGKLIIPMLNAIFYLIPVISTKI